MTIQCGQESIRSKLYLSEVATKSALHPPPRILCNISFSADRPQQRKERGRKGKVFPSPSFLLKTTRPLSTLVQCWSSGSSTYGLNFYFSPSHRGEEQGGKGGREKAVTPKHESGRTKNFSCPLLPDGRRRKGRKSVISLLDFLFFSLEYYKKQTYCSAHKRKERKRKSRSFSRFYCLAKRERGKKRNHAINAFHPLLVFSSSSISLPPLFVRAGKWKREMRNDAFLLSGIEKKGS